MRTEQRPVVVPHMVVTSVLLCSGGGVERRRLTPRLSALAQLYFRAEEEAHGDVDDPAGVLVELGAAKWPTEDALIRLAMVQRSGSTSDECLRRGLCSSLCVH